MSEEEQESESIKVVDKRRFNVKGESKNLTEEESNSFKKKESHSPLESNGAPQRQTMDNAKADSFEKVNNNKTKAEAIKNNDSVTVKEVKVKEVKDKEVREEATARESENPYTQMAGDAPPLDFSTFVMGLAHQALILLGQVEDPYTKKKEKNIEAARQTIDTIALLEEKTNGNLTSDEAKLMQESLAVLRMSYVKEAKS